MPKKRVARRDHSYDGRDRSSSSSSSDSGKTRAVRPRKPKQSGAADRTSHTVVGKSIQPIKVDSSVRFSSVGGLDDHIKCLREMVLFPLMYPNFFKRFNTRPPKGVLFHGPPGTGKTLLARALANECSHLRGRKVAFFMRKGADVMDKFYGESEKLLKSLFNKANKMRPSIIFFDEIDALAPIRKDINSEAYTSIVATLLAEMDGLCDRGDVIVIGATNRPDSVDPALRRPGRFDRELFFPPPNIIARREILDIYTEKWLPRPSEETLNYIATITSGYLGSDLQALCTEAVLKALKRVYPHVYESDYRRSATIDTRNVVVTKDDLLSAKRVISPAGGRCAPLAARSLPPHCEPLLKNQIEAASLVLQTAFPVDKERSSGGSASPSVFLICGECSETHIAPALLTKLEHCAIKELSVATIHSALVSSQEQAVISTFAECRRTERDCVIFIRDIVSVWESLEKCQGTTLLAQLWRTRAAGDSTLLFATSNVRYHELPEEVQVLFPLYKDCMYNVREPYRTEVINFLKPIINELDFSESERTEEVEPIIPPIEKVIPVQEQKSSGSSAGSSSSSASSSNSNSSNNNDPAEDTTAQALVKSVANRKRRIREGVHDQLVPNKKPRLLSYVSKRSSLSMSEDSSHNSLSTDSFHDDKVFNRDDFEKVLTDNAEALRKVGLEALIDLYEQLKKVVHSNAKVRVRAREFATIASRYVKMVKNYS